MERCTLADNFMTALNSPCFSDGSFVYIPKEYAARGELSTYLESMPQRRSIRAQSQGIADEGAYVSYREGSRPYSRQ
jgi:Fe-S cluster assembly protein SufB